MRSSQNDVARLAAQSNPGVDLNDRKQLPQNASPEEDLQDSNRAIIDTDI